MSVEKQFQSIFNSISSLEESLNELQNSANSLHDASNVNVASDFDPTAEIHSDFSDKLNTIKSQVMDKSKHLENVVSSGLNVEQMQRKMQFIELMQNRMNYYKEKN